MSKVAIAGNASGTGTLTVAAPNTDSDFTLTLPAETGTVLTSGGAIDVNASAPADSVAIDSSGNVGIKNTNPTGGVASGQTGMVVGGSATGTQFKLFTSNTGTTSSDGALFSLDGSSNAYLYNYENAALIFGTNDAERMRIDSSGSVLIGATSNPGGGTSKFVISGEDTVSVNNTSAGTGTAYAVYFKRNATGTGSITVTGSNTAYNTSSDYRLKENIAPMTGALATIQQLNPVTYNWKVDGSSGQGFIAHELQAVVPDCVTGEKDAVDADGNPVYQGIDTSFLVATLTAAIQELKAELDAAKERIAALEGGA